MDKNTQIIVALLILIIGFGAGYTIKGSGTAERHMMSDGSMMHGSQMDMESAMDGMMQELAGKTGDEFDKTFLTEMIMHHEGAVAMAGAALKSAGHQEIKDMAKAIITAQTSEIRQMQDWSKSWYGQ